MTPGAGSEAIDSPIAAVCCQQAGVVALFRLRDGEPLGTVDVGEHPVHATTRDSRVFVATMGERSVAVIDAGTVATVELGVLGPSHFAWSEDRVVVSCTGGDVVAAIEPVALTVTDRIGVGAEPHELAVADGLIYVGSRGDGQIDVVDSNAGSRTGSVRLSGPARVQGIVVSPERGHGFAVDQRQGRLCRFTLGTSPTVTGETPVGANPYDVFRFKDRLYVPGRGDGSVTVLDPALQVLETYPDFTTPTTVLESDGEHWVVDRGEAALSALGGARCPTPAGAITGRPTDAGFLLSHYDTDQLSLVSPTGGIKWVKETPATPFGTLIV